MLGTLEHSGTVGVTPPRFPPLYLCVYQVYERFYGVDLKLYMCSTLNSRDSLDLDRPEGVSVGFLPEKQGLWRGIRSTRAPKTAHKASYILLEQN